MSGTAGASGPGDPRRSERIAVDVAIRLGLLAIFSYFALVLLKPFLPLFLWSVVLAVALYPAFDWLRRRLGGRGALAAGILTALGLAIVLGPATVLIASLIESLEALAHQALVLAIVQIGVMPVVVVILFWAWFHLSSVATLILAAYMIPIALSDSPLKTLMMGKGLHTPLLVILAGVIGGTIAYGLVGLFLGPILLAVFYDLLMFWVSEAEAQGGGIE